MSTECVTLPKVGDNVLLQNISHPVNNVTLPVVNGTLPVSNITLHVNTTLLYECSPSHVIDTGDLIRTCNSTGDWSGLEPQCIDWDNNGSDTGTFTTTENETIPETSTVHWYSDNIVSDIPIYVAIGIVIAIILLSLFLLVDFIQHMKRKTRIKQRSQRHLQNGRPRPDTFLPPSKLKTVYYIEPDVKESEKIVKQKEVITESTSSKKKKKRRKTVPELGNSGDNLGKGRNNSEQYKSFRDSDYSHQPMKKRDDCVEGYDLLENSSAKRGEYNKGYDKSGDWEIGEVGFDGKIIDQSAHALKYSAHDQLQSTNVHPHHRVNEDELLQRNELDDFLVDNRRRQRKKRNKTITPTLDT